MKYISDRVRGITLISIHWKIPNYLYFDVLHFYTINRAFFKLVFTNYTDSNTEFRIEFFWRILFYKKWDKNQ